MAESTFESEWRLDFSLSEVTEAVGDSITVLLVVVSVATLTDLELSTCSSYSTPFRPSQDSTTEYPSRSNR